MDWLANSNLSLQPSLVGLGSSTTFSRYYRRQTFMISTPTVETSLNILTVCSTLYLSVHILHIATLLSSWASPLILVVEIKIIDWENQFSKYYYLLTIFGLGFQLRSLPVVINQASTAASSTFLPSMNHPRFVLIHSLPGISLFLLRQRTKKFSLLRTVLFDTMEYTPYSFSAIIFMVLKLYALL